MKISPGESVKLELSRTDKSDERRLDGIVEAIFKVSKADYVPEGVNVRSRIDAIMFTGDLPAAFLEHVEDDKNVVSVSLSKKLRLIE